MKSFPAAKAVSRTPRPISGSRSTAQAPRVRASAFTQPRTGVWRTIVPKGPRVRAVFSARPKTSGLPETARTVQAARVR